MILLLEASPSTPPRQRRSAPGLAQIKSPEREATPLPPPVNCPSHGFVLNGEEILHPCSEKASVSEKKSFAPYPGRRQWIGRNRPRIAIASAITATIRAIRANCAASRADPFPSSS